MYKPMVLSVGLFDIAGATFVKAKAGPQQLVLFLVCLLGVRAMPILLNLKRMHAYARFHMCMLVIIFIKRIIYEVIIIVLLVRLALKYLWARYNFYLLTKIIPVVVSSSLC